MAYNKDTWIFWNSNEVEIKYKGKYGAKGEKRAPKRKPTKDEIKKNNQTNKENKVRRLLKANFRPRDWWCTLKYPKGTRKSIEEVKDDFGKFTDSLRGKYKRRGRKFKFVYRIEIGERGGIHIHIVINRIKDSDLLIASSWRFGTVHFQHIREQGGMAKLANYIVKKPTEEIWEQICMFPEEERKTFIVYNTSRNLVRPKPERKTYERRTLRKEIEHGPTATKGYYIDKNSIVFGVNPYTGMSYLHYTEFKIGEGEEDAGEHLYI